MSDNLSNRLVDNAMYYVVIGAGAYVMYSSFGRPTLNIAQKVLDVGGYNEDLNVFKSYAKSGTVLSFPIAFSVKYVSAIIGEGGYRYLFEQYIPNFNINFMDSHKLVITRVALEFVSFSAEKITGTEITVFNDYENFFLNSLRDLVAWMGIEVLTRSIWFSPLLPSMKNVANNIANRIISINTRMQGTLAILGTEQDSVFSAFTMIASSVVKFDHVFGVNGYGRMIGERIYSMTPNGYHDHITKFTSTLSGYNKLLDNIAVLSNDDYGILKRKLLSLKNLRDLENLQQIGAENIKLIRNPSFRTVLRFQLLGNVILSFLSTVTFILSCLLIDIGSLISIVKQHIAKLNKLDKESLNKNLVGRRLLGDKITTIETKPLEDLFNYVAETLAEIREIKNYILENEIKPTTKDNEIYSFLLGTHIEQSQKSEPEPEQKIALSNKKNKTEQQKKIKRKFEHLRHEIHLKNNNDVYLSWSGELHDLSNQFPNNITFDTKNNDIIIKIETSQQMSDTTIQYIKQIIYNLDNNIKKPHDKKQNFVNPKDKIYNKRVSTGLAFRRFARITGFNPTETRKSSAVSFP